MVRKNPDLYLSLLSYICLEGAFADSLFLTLTYHAPHRYSVPSSWPTRPSSETALPLPTSQALLSTCSSDLISQAMQAGKLGWEGWISFGGVEPGRREGTVEQGKAGMGGGRALCHSHASPSNEEAF